MKTKMITAAAALMMASGMAGAADFVTLPNTFTPNTTAKASEVNANFEAVAAGANTNNAAIVELNTTKQSRVSSYCAAGSSIRVINANGSVTCETDDIGSGDITGVIAGAGLTGGGTSGDVTLKRAGGYVSIHNSQLVSTNSAASPLYYGYTYAYFSFGSSASAMAFASVNLPHGATVTSLTCSLYNNDGVSANNPEVVLGRITPAGSAASLASVASGGDSASLQTLTDSSIYLPVVDNQNFSYYLYYYPRDGDISAANKRFHSCQIGYTF